MTDKDCQFKVTYEKQHHAFHKLLANCDHKKSDGSSFIDKERYCDFCNKKITLNIFVMIHTNKYSIFAAYEPDLKNINENWPNAEVYRLGEADSILDEGIICHEADYNRQIEKMIKGLINLND